MSVMTKSASKSVSDSCMGVVVRRAGVAVTAASVRLKRRLELAAKETEGQGTTEYAILVGVLVVIAIVAITLFRGKIQELWDSIASSINGL